MEIFNVIHLKLWEYQKVQFFMLIKAFSWIVLLEKIVSYKVYYSASKIVL